MPVKVVGIMSGSSLDGLDMAICSFEPSRIPLQWEILTATTIPFPEAWRQDLRSAHLLGGYQLMQLDAEFGLFTGHEVVKWMDHHHLNADYIASHGHTIFHDPGAGFTTQIGSGAHIAAVTGLDTITSFRSADVAAGGQGAPFAPIADRDLFPGYEGYLNLGGIANISIHTGNGNWKAWDIGPCNQPLNHLASRLGHVYDPDGQFAASGTAIPHLVTELLEMFPFRGGQPKGLSNAEIHASWIRHLDTQTERTEDLLASVAEASSRMIASHIIPMLSGPSRILVTGGGAYHQHLISHLVSLLKPNGIQPEIPAPDLIHFKECALMAYLGYMFMNGIPFPVREITGAKRNTIGGVLHKAIR